ncbi:hypothetical protein MXB_1427 [Myxobolus squamalis]|nr:hypothetical protein MXB_1427 [Myxobolus squamalis]
MVLVELLIKVVILKLAYLYQLAIPSFHR